MKNKIVKSFRCGSCAPSCVYRVVTLSLLLVCRLASGAEATGSGADALPKMVAHRGAGDLTMPEASLAAYSNAVATAVDIVKLDVQFTKDGIAVMGHDISLKRNMGWDVNIADLTYAEILQKGRFLENGRPGGQRIVRLDQALSIVKPVPAFWIDFKDKNRFKPEQVENVVAAFRAADIDLGRVTIASFNRKAIACFRELYPQVRRVAHCSFGIEVDKKRELEALLKMAEQYGLFGLNMPVLNRQTTPEDIAMLKAHGLWVSLWFVQDAETAIHYRAARADAFVTDYVSTVRKTLEGDMQKNTISDSGASSADYAGAGGENDR